jgi:hypothetical protein
MYPAGAAATAIIAVTVATAVAIKRRQQNTESWEDSDFEAI